MMRRAWASSHSRRAFSRSSCAMRFRSGRVGSALRPRRCGANAPSAAWSRCLRQLESIEEYRRSRRMNAPSSPGFLRRSASAKKPPFLTGRESSPLGRGHHLRVRSASRGRTHLCTDQGIYPIRVHVPACLYFKLPRQVSQLILAHRECATAGTVGLRIAMLRTSIAGVVSRSGALIRTRAALLPGQQRRCSELRVRRAGALLRYCYLTATGRNTGPSD